MLSLLNYNLKIPVLFYLLIPPISSFTEEHWFSAHQGLGVVTDTGSISND